MRNFISCLAVATLFWASWPLYCCVAAAPSEQPKIASAAESDQKQETAEDSSKHADSTRAGLSSHVNEPIEQLRSSSPRERIRAILALKRMRLRAFDAVPSLILLLDDDTRVEVPVDAVIGYRSAAHHVAVTRFSSVKSEAGDALKAITRQDFGEDKAKWSSWWATNKDEIVQVIWSRYKNADSAFARNFLLNELVAIRAPLPYLRDELVLSSRLRAG